MQRLSRAPRSASCPASALLRASSNKGLLSPTATTSPSSATTTTTTIACAVFSRRSRSTVAWKKRQELMQKEFLKQQLQEQLAFEQYAADKQREVEQPLEEERLRQLTANNKPDAVAPFWDTTRPKRHDADPGEGMRLKKVPLDPKWHDTDASEGLRVKKWLVNLERHDKDAREGMTPSRKKFVGAPKRHDTDTDAGEGYRSRNTYDDTPKPLPVEVDRAAWRKVVRQEAAPGPWSTGVSALDKVVDLAQKNRKERLANTKNQTPTWAHLSNLPADCTKKNVMEALVAAAPIGRVMAMTFTPPSPRNPHNSMASIEFSTVLEAERLYRSTRAGKFLVNKAKPYVTLQPKTGDADDDRPLLDGPQYKGFPPSRVLFIRGPKLNPVMDVEAIRTLLTSHDVDAEAESVQINKVGNTITILWKFFCWRYGARHAMTVLRRNTTVGVWYGLDPCEYAPGTMTGWKEYLVQQRGPEAPTVGPQEHVGGKPQQVISGHSF